MSEAVASGNAVSIRPARLVAGMAALLVLLATLPFLPTLRGPFFWDDEANVVFNRTLRLPAGLTAIWTDTLASFQYYPLTYSLFWFEYRVFEDRPFGYHAVNVLLHALNALFIWRAAAKMGATGAWWIAALFAVHPVQVETVGWISEQKNLLSTLFSLLVLLCWESFISTRRMPSLLLGTFFFLAALASKTVVVVLPVYLLVQELVRGRAPWKCWLPPILLWLAVGVAAGRVTVERETATSVMTGVPADTPPNLKFDERLLLATQSLWRYVGMLCCLEPFVPIPERSLPSWSNPWALASLFGTAVVVVGVLRLMQRGWLTPFLGLSFFAIHLGPTLGVFRFQFQCHSFVGDHFAYLACAGFFAALGAAWFRDWAPYRRIVAIVVVLTLAVATWRQSVLFADPVQLWRRNTEANPSAWAAWVNLSDLLLKRNDLEGGLRIAERAAEVEPTAAMAHHNMGLAFARLGKPREAERAFREAGRLLPNDPRMLHNLGYALCLQQRWREAIENLERAAAIAPDFPPTHLLLGESYRKLDMKAQAIRAYERALEIDPALDAARKVIESLRRQEK